MSVIYSMISLVVLASSIVFLWLMRHHPKINSWLIFGIAVFLLVYKSCEYSYYAITHTGYSPVEFSHLSYLIFGAVFTFGFAKIGLFGAFVALLSGFGFLVGAIVSPSFMADDLYLVIAGYISHTLLFIGGGLALFDHKYYSWKQIYGTYIGLFSMLMYGVLIYTGVLYHLDDPVGSSNFIKMITGEFMVSVFGEGISVFGKCIGAIALVSLILAAVPVILCMSNLIVSCHVKYFEKHNDVYEPVLHGFLPYLNRVMDRREERKKNV